uniref:EDR1/CTR1/ARMC3-like peptidase-like domain-containing protein n=1 Tax=Salix viminalis TaxID=40686 RepID=A0A6N2ML54_SALVM
MPHRTTYFFPRQFPDRSGFNASSSSKQALDHEKKKIIKDAFYTDNDPRMPSSKNLYSTVGKNTSQTTSTPTTITTPISDLFTSSDDEKYHPKTKQFGKDDRYKQKKKQLAAFFDWLSEKKLEKSTAHVKLQISSTEEDCQLLLTPEPEPDPVLPAPEIIKERDVDRNFDRQVSLPRLSSGSSYGSLFSGITTIDGNFTTDIKVDSSTTVHVGTIKQEVAVQEEIEEKEDQKNKNENLVLKTKESYYLQLSLAKRLSAQAGIASELLFLQEGVPEASDAQTVSYRLWVSGCLSYRDKISDGFYNILGMNPYLWVMCNEDEEGSRLPPIMSLKEIEPSETSMEVVLVDRRGDSRLKELEDKAQELYCASESTLVLVEQLGKLVAIYMGIVGDITHGDSFTVYRLVAIMRRRSRFVIVKIQEESSTTFLEVLSMLKNLVRYVVDLVGSSQNLHGPDSPINGGFFFSMFLPFQINHIKDHQQPYLDDAPYEILESKQLGAFPEIILCSGMNKEVERNTVVMVFILTSTYVQQDQ